MNEFDFQKHCPNILPERRNIKQKFLCPLHHSNLMVINLPLNVFLSKRNKLLYQIENLSYEP